MNIRDFFVLRTSKTLYSDVLPYIHNAFIANGTLRERVLAADIYTMDPSHGSGGSYAKKSIYGNI